MYTAIAFAALIFVRNQAAPPIPPPGSVVTVSWSSSPNGPGSGKMCWCDGAWTYLSADHDTDSPARHWMMLLLDQGGLQFALNTVPVSADTRLKARRSTA